MVIENLFRTSYGGVEPKRRKCRRSGKGGGGRIDELGASPDWLVVVEPMAIMGVPLCVVEGRGGPV
jgi:hypothetical protein